jgi:hypothetical protein
MFKKTLVSTKNFVRRHQTQILITTTVVATAIALGMKKGLNEHDEFLKEHDLYDEYYTPVD